MVVLANTAEAGQLAGAVEHFFETAKLFLVQFCGPALFARGFLRCATEWCLGRGDLADSGLEDSRLLHRVLTEMVALGVVVFLLVVDLFDVESH